MRLTARFFKHRSACVAVSGMFLDPADAEGGPPAESAGQFLERIEGVTDPADLASLLADIAANRMDLRRGYMVLARLFQMEDQWLTGYDRRTLHGVQKAGARPCYSPANAWLRMAENRGKVKSSLEGEHGDGQKTR